MLQGWILCRGENKKRHFLPLRCFDAWLVISRNRCILYSCEILPIPSLYGLPTYVLINFVPTNYTQEIIQNADDAEASNVTFYLDNRVHGTDSLIVKGLEKFQGPALLAFNDAKFTAADWDSIQKPEQSGKEKDPFKVGKFGLGFNSVYHITGEYF